MIYTSLYGSIEYADGTLEIILEFFHQKSIHLKSVRKTGLIYLIYVFYIRKFVVQIVIKPTFKAI